MSTLTFSIICWFSLFAQLQPPSPAPRKDGQNREQHGGTKDQVTTDAKSPAHLNPPVSLDHDADMEAGGTKNQSGQGNKKPPEHWWQDPITLFTFILAVAAVIQLLIYGTQARYMYRGLQLTQSMIEHMRLEQRAWIGSVGPTMEELKVGEKPNCLLTLKNTGHTPGTIVERAMFFRPIKNDDETLEGTVEELLGLSPTKSQHVIPPDGAIRFPIENTNVMDERLMALIAEQTVLLILIVRVVYDDVMHKSRTTQCCYYYDVPANELRAHPKYNEMT